MKRMLASTGRADSRGGGIGWGQVERYVLKSHDLQRAKAWWNTWYHIQPHCIWQSRGNWHIKTKPLKEVFTESHGGQKGADGCRCGRLRGRIRVKETTTRILASGVLSRSFPFVNKFAVSIFKGFLVPPLLPSKQRMLGLLQAASWRPEHVQPILECWEEALRHCHLGTARYPDWQLRNMATQPLETHQTEACTYLFTYVCICLFASLLTYILLVLAKARTCVHLTLKEKECVSLLWVLKENWKCW